MRLASRARCRSRGRFGRTPSVRDARAIRKPRARGRSPRARSSSAKDATWTLFSEHRARECPRESRRTRRRSWRDGRDARHHANLGVRLRLRPRDGVVPRGVQIRTVRAGVRRFDPPRTRTFPAACVVPPRPFATSSAPALRHPLTPRSRRPTPTRPQEYVRGTRPVLRHHPHGTPPPRLNPSPRTDRAARLLIPHAVFGARAVTAVSSTTTASALELPLTAQTLTLIRALTLSIFFFSFADRRPRDDVPPRRRVDPSRGSRCRAPRRLPPRTRRNSPRFAARETIATTHRRRTKSPATPPYIS